MQGARSTGTLIECLSPLENSIEEEEREKKRQFIYIFLKRTSKQKIKKISLLLKDA